MPHATLGKPAFSAPAAPVVASLPAASPSAALRRLAPTLSDAERRRLAQGAAAVVGVDAGKYAHTLVVRPRGGDDSKPFTFPSTRDGCKGRYAETTCDALQAAAARTVGLPGAQGALAGEVAHVVERLLLLQRQRAELEATLADALAGVESAAALATIPFMGPTTVGVFLGSLGDPRTCASARQVLALAGLALVERSSGTFHSRHRISKRGRALLRHYLHIAALRHVGKAGLYRAPYEAMVKRNGGRKRAALIAVARHLLRLMYAVARDGVPFDRARHGTAVGPAPPAGSPA